MIEGAYGFFPNAPHGVRQIGPGGLSGRESQPHPCNQFGQLRLGHAVAKSRHESGLNRGRGLNTIQNDPDQIVRLFTIKIGIECEWQVLPEHMGRSPFMVTATATAFELPLHDAR